MLTESQIKKFALINDKIRAEELRAREYLINLRAVLDGQVESGVVDDYEFETHFSVSSYDEDYCRSKEVEVGDSFYETSLYKLAPDDDEFFHMNWYITSWIGCDQLKDFHFGYLMHCLLDHTCLKIEDVLAIDDVWIEIVVTYQFFTDKNSNSDDDCN